MSEETLDRTLNKASRKLSEAREAMGLSQKAVADQLYLTTTFIKYIDEGEFDKIPKPAFIKGYLRSYARVVELDRDEVVRLFEEDIAQQEEDIEIRGVTEESVGSAAITGPVVQTGLAGLGALVLLVILVWVFADSDDEPIPVVTQPDRSEPAPVEADPVPTPVTEPLPPAVDEALTEDDIDMAMTPETEEPALLPERVQEAETQADESLTEPVSAVLAVPEAQADELLTDDALPESVTSLAVSIERYEEAGVRYIILDAGGADELQFRFSDECWVEVEDAEGAAIYGDLNRAGDVLRVYVDVPARVLFGRATVVQAEFNGDDFDISRYITSDDTAKVTFDG